MLNNPPPQSWQDQITIGTKDHEPTWDSGEAGGLRDAQALTPSGVADTKGFWRNMMASRANVTGIE